MSHEESAGSGLTSFHLQRARSGSGESLAWIVARLSPLLRAQASYRLPKSLLRFCDADDMVNEVWSVALPRLAELGEPGRRCTPALLKFLGTTLLHKANQLIVRHMRERELEPLGPGSTVDPDRWAASVTSALAAAQRDEARTELEAALARLDEKDRELIVLRGIEQLTNQQAATLLGENQSTVAMRYARALAKLRSQLPDSIVEELPD